MRLIADSITDIFGKINPPPGPGALYDDPIVGLSKLLTVFIQLSLTAGAIILLIYALWGGLDYILSEGDKEKLTKARSKMTSAFTGLLIMIVSLTLYGLFVGDVLGILKKEGGTWKINVPMINSSPSVGGGTSSCPGSCIPIPPGCIGRQADTAHTCPAAGHTTQICCK